ncbi:MAG TPA: hypothetical protein VGK04_05590 [Thermoanaerobaculia bacterium]
MKLVAEKALPEEPENNIVEFVVSDAQLDYLGRVSRDINPDMPMAFGGAHVVRTLLERFEESGIDLTAATSEEELTHIAARKLRQRNRESRRTRA